jgi:acyl-homoserine lactone acylase PvdQ
MRGLGRFIGAAALCAVCALPASATAAPTPQPYRHNDFGGFHDILPAGENGFASDSDLLAWELDNNTRPAHSNDQYAMYRDLQYATPGLTTSQIGTYYKDSSFGFPPGHDERTYSPRGDVTIVRDSDFGVPHVYGATRAGAMFGLGYATAEDRLFFIDALRHAGRAQLSSFAGGANREMDEGVWADTPYTEKDLERQFNYSPPGYHQAAAQLRDDAQNYVAGINKYITEARANKVQKMPAEYGAIGKPTGPGLWKPTDLISEAALIGGIFGNGGGNELNSALTLEAAIQKFGPRKGVRVWRDFRDAEDPEAPLTARIGRFPYEVPPRHPHGVALPDPGSLKRAKVVASASGSAAGARHYQAGSSATPPLPPGLNTDGLAGGLKRGNSNALLISRRESKTGRPVAVMGPQVAYFNPEILMEQDVHAPTIDARGAAFPGVNLYVQLGRGRDYSWSATSAGQDVIDTFAVPLCKPNGSAPTRGSNHYLFRGRCLKFQTLTRNISWLPNLGDPTPAGSETLKTQRSKLGIVIGRARVNGRPVAYTKLRTSYRHEIDSALGFSYFNNPNKIHNARDFQRAAYLVSFTFNWFYVDNRDVAYFNSGGNPERAPGTDPNFPVLAVPGNYWRGFDASKNTMTLTPFRQHPQVINQSYITSWNNKQAHGYRAADDNYHYGPIYRSSLLNEQIRKRIAGAKKIGLNQLIDAMELAGTTDLRGDFVLPLALRVMRSRPIADPALRKAVNQLGAWVRAGAHRIDRDKNGTYAHSDAIRIMDAWWPLWLRAEFRPTMGTNFFNHVEGMNVFDDPNRTGHLGSAFDDGWYGYANKDLRTILGRNVKGRFSRVYCGGGSLARCRRALLHSLSHALGVDPYQGNNSGCGVGDDQMCADAVQFRTVGGIAQPDMPWINRPTYQQALSIQAHRPR